MREAAVRDMSVLDGSREPRKLETARKWGPSARPSVTLRDTAVDLFSLLGPIFGARSSRTVKY